MRLLLLMLCLGCDRQNFVELVAVEGDNGPAGFTCRMGPCQNGICAPLLFQRAADAVRPSPRGIALDPDFAGAKAMGSAVVDLLTLGPGPSDSDPFVVVARCTIKGICQPILRRCFPLDLTILRDSVDASGAGTSGVLFDDIFLQLQASGALLSADAPDDEVLVRMVTTTLTCDQIAQRPLRFSQWPADDPVKWGQSIFGCGYSGPFHLDAEHGPVFLGLPTLDAVDCVSEAAVCAADFDPRQSGALLDFP